MEELNGSMSMVFMSEIAHPLPLNRVLFGVTVVCPVMVSETIMDVEFTHSVS